MFIEIIAVLLLMAILSAAFGSRYLDSEADLVAGVGVLGSHLRYAQGRALATSNEWYIQFDTTSTLGSYTLYQRDSGGNVTTETFPGETGTAVAMVSGMAVSDGNGAVALFNGLGQPFTDAAGANAQSGKRTLVTASVGDVVIHPETGYVP